MLESCTLGAVCFFVRDLDRSERFYRDVLGLEVQRMPGEGDEPEWMMARTANAVELLFFVHEVTVGQSPVVVFGVPKGIDDVVSSLAEQGVTIVTPVSHAPGGWSAEFLDPDEHVISLFQEADQPRSEK